MRSYLKLLKIAPEITRPEQEAQKAGADGSSTGKKPRGFSAPGAFGLTGRSVGKQVRPWTVTFIVFSDPASNLLYIPAGAFLPFFHAGYISPVKTHIDLFQLPFPIDIVLVHFGDPRGAAVTGGGDITKRICDDLLAFFFCCIPDQQRLHMAFHSFPDYHDIMPRIFGIRRFPKDPSARLLPVLSAGHRRIPVYITTKREKNALLSDVLKHVRI